MGSELAGLVSWLVGRCWLKRSEERGGEGEEGQ